MDEYETTYENICKISELGLVMFPGHWNITQGITLCKHVRGEINVIKDANNSVQMIELMNKSDICRGDMQNPCNSFNSLTEKLITVSELKQRQINHCFNTGYINLALIIFDISC